MLVCHCCRVLSPTPSGQLVAFLVLQCMTRLGWHVQCLGALMTQGSLDAAVEAEG